MEAAGIASSHYSKFHAKYLKVLTQKGFVELPRAKTLFEEIKTNFPTESDLEFETAVQQINHKLQPFNKQVTVKKHEQFNLDYVVFSSTLAPIPELLAQQKFMHPNDYKYFEAILKTILTSDEYKIRYKVALTTSPESLNESSGPRKKRSLATDNEALLQSWIQLGYLAQRDGFVFLGPKSLAEFGSYIQATYPDLEVCPLCLSITFMQHKCLLCAKSFHDSCLDRFWLTKPHTCPSCNKDWGQSSSSSH